MTEWFCTLLDTAPDVYFRYALHPNRGFAYVSPSVQALTGRSPQEFQANPDLCLSLLVPGDRRAFRRVLRARRGLVLRLHVVRDAVTIPIEVKTVAVVRHRRLVAVEGVARLVVGAGAGRSEMVAAAAGPEPVQQRLAALMFEVHELLHRVLPQTATGGSHHGHDGQRLRSLPDGHILRLADLVLDTARLAVTDAGRSVALTTREVMLLRYLLERTGRIVTRAQLLADVWDYTYTGYDRTVDVHVSRLRKKLPSLRQRLTAIRNLGYRLDVDAVDGAARAATR